MRARRRICFVVASEITATAFLLDQIRSVAALHEVCVALNTENPAFLAAYGISVEVVAVPIERRVRPLTDLKALAMLWRLFRARRFDLVHSVSPKAGLLAMLAGFLAGVPRRLHVFTGQVWVTRSGLQRWILKHLDNAAAGIRHVLRDKVGQFTERHAYFCERLRPGLDDVLLFVTAAFVDVRHTRHGAQQRLDGVFLDFA